jgi:hypothetical protein
MTDTTAIATAVRRRPHDRRLFLISRGSTTQPKRLEHHPTAAPSLGSERSVQDALNHGTASYAVHITSFSRALRARLLAQFALLVAQSSGTLELSGFERLLLGPQAHSPQRSRLHGEDRAGCARYRCS